MQEQLKIYFHGQYGGESGLLLAYPGTKGDMETSQILEGRGTIRMLKCVTPQPECVYNLLRKRDYGTYYTLITPSCDDARQGFMSIIIVVKEGYRADGKTIFRLLNLLNERIHKAGKLPKVGEIVDVGVNHIIAECVKEAEIQCYSHSPISWESKNLSHSPKTAFRIYDTEDELCRYLNFINQPIYKDYRDVCFVRKSDSPIQSQEADLLSGELSVDYRCKAGGVIDGSDISWIISLGEGHQDFITGASATVTYTRPGFKPIKKAFQVGKNSPYVTYEGDTIVVNPLLPSDKFVKVLKVQLVDEEGQAITSAKLNISSSVKSSYSYSYIQSSSLFEAELDESSAIDDITITVNAPGYENKEKSVKYKDISSSGEPVSIFLKKKRNEVCIILSRSVVRDKEQERELAANDPTYHGIPLELKSEENGVRTYEVRKEYVQTIIEKCQQRKKKGKKRPASEPEYDELQRDSLIDKCINFVYGHRRLVGLILTIFVVIAIVLIIRSHGSNKNVEWMLFGCSRDTSETSITEAEPAEVFYNPSSEKDNLTYMQNNDVWKRDSLQSGTGKAIFEAITTGAFDDSQKNLYENGGYVNQMNQIYIEIKDNWKALSADGKNNVKASIKSRYPKGAGSDQVDLNTILGVIKGELEAQAQRHQPTTAVTQPTPPSEDNSTNKTIASDKREAVDKGNTDAIMALKVACCNYNIAYKNAQNAKNVSAKKGRSSAELAEGNSDALSQANAELKNARKNVIDAHKKAYPNYKEPQADKLKACGLKYKLVDAL